MIIRPRFFPIFLLIVLPLFAQAEKKFDTLTLSQDEQWLALLHIAIEKKGDNFESYVDDSKFFLAADGVTNPENELLATIKALKVNKNTQCIYPARTLFLVNKLPHIANEIPASSCDEYIKWRKKLNTESVVLVFADAQLNSPSSMYGHTFLRFDAKNIEQHSTYLSHALNFGATIPADENGLLYAAKGLTGGYPGNFASNPYFEKIKEYARLENRDLWEYTLNLSTTEIDILLAHVWELREVNFEYYFFDENCSFRLLELLDVARPNMNLAGKFPVTAMPLDTIRVVKDANLVINTHYRPSVLTELESQLALLSADERLLVLALSEDINFLSTEEFSSLPAKTKQLVVDSAYRYLRYQNTFNERQPDITRRSFELLRYLNKNPTRLNIPVEEPVSPENGHNTAMIGASIGNRDGNNYIEMKYRGSYHDLLDPIAGYHQGMALNMVNISFRLYEEGGMALEKAELLDIFSLSERNEFLSPWSWKANVSLEQQWTDGKEILVTQGTAGRGVSYRPLDDSHLFLLATGRLELNRKLDVYANIAPGLHAGFLYYWPKTTLLIEAEHYQFLFDQTKRSKVSFQQSLQLGKNDSLRLSADYNIIGSKVHEDKNYNELKLEYRHYF